MAKVKFIGGPMDNIEKDYPNIYEYHYIYSGILGKLHRYKSNFFGTELIYIDLVDVPKDLRHTEF